MHSVTPGKNILAQNTSEIKNMQALEIKTFETDKG